MLKDKKPYRILVVEDNPGDFLLVEEFLMEAIAFPATRHARNFREAVQILESAVFDVILLDLSLPDKSGEALVAAMLKSAPLHPIIVLTGYTDIDFSIRSIALGIIDYIVKDDLNAAMLHKSIAYAIERKKNITELKESEKRYSDLFHLSPQPMCLYEAGTFRFTAVNKAGIDHYGYTQEEFLGMTLFDLVPAEERDRTTATVGSQDRVINQTYTGKFRNTKKSGEVIEVETYSTPLLIDGGLYTLVIANDVTEKNLYEHKITKAIIKAQDDERYEIGGELHDNVCQILASSLLSLGMVKRKLPEDTVPLLDQCRDYINMAASEIRNLSHRLAPAFFKDSNLEEAIQALVRSFNPGSSCSVLLDYNQSMRAHKIGLELQLNLYRILQEQLKNIFKYAAAGKIEIDILAFNKRLKMRVSDDGTGFDPATVKKGIGIANMQRRAELFAGKFEIDSFPGNGCTILVDIPLDQQT